MIKIRTTLQYRGLNAEPTKGFKEVVAGELTAAGEHWARKYLPSHFERTAYTRYPGAYQRRTAKYEKSALKRGKGPMVYSGIMRSQVLSSQEIRATDKRMTVTMRGVRALNLAGKISGRRMCPYPDFRAELTAIAPSEMNDLARVLDRGVTRRLDLLGMRGPSRTVAPAA